MADRNIDPYVYSEETNDMNELQTLNLSINYLHEYQSPYLAEKCK